MMQDVAYIVDRTKNLTDSTLPSRISPLEELVKAKPFPRRAAHMSNALNGLLRRKNDAASSSTASLNDSPTLTQSSEKEAPEIEDDEDALAASDPPANNAKQPENTAEEGQSQQAPLINPETADDAAVGPNQEENSIVNASSDELPKEEPASTAQEAYAQGVTSEETGQEPKEDIAARSDSLPLNP